MALALVKSAKNTASTSTVSPAFGSATTAGNLVVLCFAADDYNGTVSAGWTQSAEMEQQTFHGGYVWWCISAGQTIMPSFVLGSATTSAWVLTEWSGVDASPYDISQGQLAQSSGGSYTSDVIVPSVGERLLVAAFGGSAAGTQDISGAYSAWTNSFTGVDSVGWATGSARVSMGVGYRLVTGDGSTSFSTGANYPNTVQSRSGLIISFKASSGGSPQTWSGSTATVSITGVSGTFAPGSTDWSGSAATVALFATSGSFTPGSVVWSGSAATVALTGVSGSFTPGSVVWSGSTATVTLTALSGSFTEGDRPGADFWSTVAIGSGAISVVSGVAYSCFANGYEFCVFEPDTAVALNRWSTGARTNLTQPNVMTDATASAFHRHEMAYLSTGLLDYRLDGASIVSATNSAHVAASKSLYIGQGHSSTSSRWGGRTDVEWVGVRTYDGVDSVQTVGAETAT